MSISRVFVVTALLAGATCAFAQVQLDPAAPVSVGAPKALAPAVPAAAAPQVRPGMFAAASAATFKRLTPEQRDEWRFLKEASAVSRFESAASRVALARSNHAGVRSFATGLIDHHAEAGPVLQQMLQARNMAAPMFTNEQRKVLNRLGKLNGGRFDREFLDEVAQRSGQENIAAFERASATVRDAALKAWIDRTLPTLRHQLAQADRVTSGNPRQARAQPKQVTLPASTQAKMPVAMIDTRVLGGSAASGQLGDPAAVNMQLGPAQPLAARTSATVGR